MIEKAETFRARIITEVKLDYLLTLPDGYGKDDTKWPLLLFLHGAGERGTEVQQIRAHGIPKITPFMEDFPFITLAPQCPVNHWWSDYLEMLIGMIDATINNYSVDTDRVYLSGLGMGGFGSWHLATEYPERFAAVVPICGGGLWAYGFPERVSEMKAVPVWAFHGAQDDVVPLQSTTVMVEALQACGGAAKLTVYPEADHDSWTETYDNPELYEWLLAHKISDRAEANQE
ncbi:prolyl oligopeptidase family serine peptidase [Chloroflexota bacterium]